MLGRKLEHFHSKLFLRKDNVPKKWAEVTQGEPFKNAHLKERWEGKYLQDKLTPLAWSKVGRWCLFVWRRGEGAGMGQTDDRQETTKVAVSARQRADIVGLSWARTVVTYSRGGACKRLRASSTSTGLNYTSAQSSRRDNGRYRIPHEQLAKTYLKRYRWRAKFGT